MWKNVHCIIHQQNLCSKSSRLKNVIDVVVNTVNFIRSRGLNNRQFKAFLDELSLEHDDVTYYCEIRWLSKGKMLKRFFDLRKEIADFIEMKEKALPQICDPTCLCDLAFLVDITKHLNDLNLNLQKQGQLVNQLYNHVISFQNNIRLWETQMRSKHCFHFSMLSCHENIESYRYAEELKLLSEQFTDRFSYFKNMEALSIFLQILVSVMWKMPRFTYKWN
ncbi:unnamed protein product [Psylliodes chrysocephalus]|uniref:Uncharacterized protein n=1 Tax=Psylliodes chrysocephalus TaxID=3402493 RepID=A0A9P0CN09_9CUCU|nr:unnamed protein product [Psylliodes chrysocephala]